jgi:hypothetical protein
MQAGNTRHALADLLSPRRTDTKHAHTHTQTHRTQNETRTSSRLKKRVNKIIIVDHQVTALRMRIRGVLSAARARKHHAQHVPLVGIQLGTKLLHRSEKSVRRYAPLTVLIKLRKRAHKRGVPVPPARMQGVAHAVQELLPRGREEADCRRLVGALWHGARGRKPAREQLPGPPWGVSRVYARELLLDETLPSFGRLCMHLCMCVCMYVCVCFLCVLLAVVVVSKDKQTAGSNMHFHAILLHACEHSAARLRARTCNHTHVVCIPKKNNTNSHSQDIFRTVAHT